MSFFFSLHFLSALVRDCLLCVMEFQAPVLVDLDDVAERI